MEGRLRQRRIWERSLPQMSPRFVSDTVLYAVMVRRGRVLLLSNRHVIYCKARTFAPETFRLRWYLDVANINNVLGAHPPPARLMLVLADTKRSRMFLFLRMFWRAIGDIFMLFRRK